MAVGQDKIFSSATAIYLDSWEVDAFLLLACTVHAYARTPEVQTRGWVWLALPVLHRILDWKSLDCVHDDCNGGGLDVQCGHKG